MAQVNGGESLLVISLQINFHDGTYYYLSAKDSGLHKISTKCLRVGAKECEEFRCAGGIKPFGRGRFCEGC